MNVQIEESWKAHLQPEFEKDYFRTLTDFVRDEYGKYAIYPPGKLIFNAFNLCPFDKVKVVIIGQDPYHGPGQAHGLCFSVNDGVPFPPSLLNIFKEIKNDIGTDAPTTGNLTRWAEQGILLLNATLTVRAHQAGSHQNRGWETFTDAAIRILAEEKEHLVFILWGAYAQRKGAFIDRSRHLVLTSAHPSPLSAYNGFFGSNDAFPVPLVYIKGMQIAQFFIGTDGIHVCVDAISRFDMVFGKREAFPFGEGVHHFSFGVAQIFDRESYGTFHSIEVVIDTHSFQYEQWSCHTSQAQFGREVQLEELFNLFNP